MPAVPTLEPEPAPTALSLPTAASSEGADLPADVVVYEGLGAWLDVWDYSPNYASGGVPVVGPEIVDEMAAAGVQTLYLQTVRRDDRSTTLTEDPALLAAFLRRAHDHDMAVVGWYLPTWTGPENEDLDRLVAVLDFDVDGQTFDGIAVDIEGVPAPEQRVDWNQRLVSLTTALRAAAGDRALGAIVLPPVVLEDVNVDYWPGFPWVEIGPHYDAWLPMTYWSFRKPDSPWADSAAYTAANIDRVRSNIGDPDAIVHAIGGIGLNNDPTTSSEPLARVEDLTGFVQAAEATNSAGWSIYDWLTISPEGHQLITDLSQPAE